jgi:hypothetical protein
MASVIQVANRALTKLGAARITSLADDNKQARAVSSCFDDLRDAELRAHRWQFSLKRVELAALVAAPTFGYNFQYQVPADFLKLDMVDDRFPDVNLDGYVNAEFLDYVLEGNVILTSIGAPLKLRYVAQITDPNAWDALFREALACRIAAEIAEDLTQSTPKRQQAWDEYKQAVNLAVKAGSIERQPVLQADTTWIFGRL